MLQSTDLSARASSQPKLLVAIPALNEQETVANVVRGVPERIPGVGSTEILVIDDGSSDLTARRAREAGAVVLSHPVPSGVGAAFHSALAYALETNADLIVSLDADGQFDSGDIPAVLAPVLAGEADFATASRFLDPSLQPDMPWLKLVGNRLMSRIISSLAGQRFHDVSCGMRCYSRKTALHLHLLAPFTYTQEVFLNLAFKRMRIVEVPIRVHGERAVGKSRVAASLWRYGLKTMTIILRSYRDYHPLRFFGSLAAVLFFSSAVLGAFLLTHYVQTGGFSPHKWSGVVASILLGLAVLLLHLGIIGDMLNRHRVYLEELLYRQRRRE